MTTAEGVPTGPWNRPKREGHKVNRLIVSESGETIAWIGHGNDKIAESIASYLVACAPKRPAHFDDEDRNLAEYLERSGRN